jgi:dihydroxyacetone kinase
VSTTLEEAVLALRDYATALNSAAASYRGAWREHRTAMDALAVAVLKLQEAYGDDLAGAPEAVREAVDRIVHIARDSTILSMVSVDDLALTALGGEARLMEMCASEAEEAAALLRAPPLAREGGAA